MFGLSWRYSAPAIASIAIVVLGSCKDRQADIVGAASRESSSAAAPADRTPASAPDSGGLSDANIVALLDEANAADSASGAYALGKATNPDVKAFAKLMMGEHHALRAQGQRLAKRLNVSPEAPRNDPLKPAAEAEMMALKAAPKGQQFDRTYVDQRLEFTRLYSISQRKPMTRPRIQS